jgi:mRNA-degrading endonuclease RelE of RelBE toxin-antitoxin system
MNYNIFPTRQFERELKRYVKKFPSLKKEYADLITSLKENPESGEPLGKHCYKIRLAISSKGKGKSGGARIITYIYLQRVTIYLLTIYDKSEKQDVTDGELKAMIKSLKL